LSVRIYYDNTKFRLKDSKKVGKKIEKVIRKEGRVSGDLNFIFTDEETIRKINIQFLNHDYFTDVITFNYNVDNKISGEIYISIETVKINSINYNVSFNSEILRVMLHGVLHLLGYDDKCKEDNEIMRSMEDFLLKDCLEELNEL
jgi:probable rRNA maturation factor